MTTEIANLTNTRIPFIFRFSEAMPTVKPLPLKFDGDRQVSQVFLDGTWVDALNVRLESVGSTRMTKVFQETTDDE